MKKFLLIIISGLLMLSVSCDNYFNDMEMQKKLTEGLVGYWPVTESPGSSSIKDYSENNVPITLVTSFSISDGKFSSGLKSPDTDTKDYASYTGYDLLKGKNSSTLCFWLKHGGSSTHRVIVSSNSFFTIYITPDASSLFIYANIGDHNLNGSGHIRIGNINVKPDEWYHVVAVFTNKELSLYLNGNCMISETGTYVLPRIDSFYIGNNSGFAGIYAPSDTFNGLLDEIRIYNRALSQEEIKALMEIGVD